jgi:hypothetical protein
VNAWKAVERLVAAALPWPTRQQRKAAIEAARAEAATSRRSAGDARMLSADITRRNAGNHWAQAIAHQIRLGRE